MPIATPVRRPASWTLRTKLVAAMTGLFLLVSLASGALILLSARGKPLPG